MNTLNRAITIVVLVAILILILSLALSPNTVGDWLQMRLGDGLSAIDRYQMTDPTNFTLARIAVVIAAILLIAPLILAEFQRQGESVVRLETPSGTAQVTADSIARRLSWHLDQLADVIAVQPSVRARGNQVDVNLDVETSPEVDVPMKTEEIMLVTREVVEDSMGLRIGRLDVRIRHSEYPEYG
ncbi:MAG: hypothetical protein J5I90_04720 [Caldilineales bacterium]|nr:hypothetical protein [Caldilineales bacterium]